MSDGLLGAPLLAWWPAIPASVAMGVIAQAAWRVRGCTLVAPLIWAIVSLGLVSTSALATVVSDGNPAAERYASWQVFPFLAATSTFCPIASLLGAKRPQSKAWQLIVLALWLVASLPAIQALIAHSDESLVVHAVWGWFYAILILVGAINYLPTWFALAALLVAAGQVCALWPHLPLVGALWGEPPPTATFVLFSSAAIVTAGLHRMAAPSRGMYGWSRVWRNFRNAYGLVWGVRVMERVNSIAASEQIPVSLQWHGFCPTGTADSASAESANVDRLEPPLRQLLSRFVSRRWIDERLKSMP